MDRRLRLREDADIRRVRSRGRSVAEGPLLGRVLANGLVPPRNRYTVVAGKKQGNAVARNRVKRLVREGLRGLHPTLRPGHDLVVIVRGTVAELPDAATARRVLDRIVRRANLVQAPATPTVGSAGARPPSADGRA